MGIWDKVKDAGHTLGEKASQGAKALSDEIARRQEEARLKRELLGDFSGDDLKAFCKFYGYAGPDPYYEDDNGKRKKRTLERGDWLDYCMDKSLDKLKKYAERDRRLSYEAKGVLTEINNFMGKVPTPQAPQPMEGVTQMEVNVKSATPVNIEIKPSISEFDEVLNAIKNEYEDTIRDQFFRDEDAFNDNLATFLKTKFGTRLGIENTRRLHRDTGDIFINGKYVLEQKYADNPGTLNQGLYELKKYNEKRYPGIAFVILDTGKITSQVLQFKKYYEDDGAKVIIIRGQGERKKPKTKFVPLASQ